MSSSPSISINITLKDEQLENYISGAPDPTMPKLMSTVLSSTHLFRSKYESKTQVNCK